MLTEDTGYAPALPVVPARWATHPGSDQNLDGDDDEDYELEEPSEEDEEMDDEDEIEDWGDEDE